MSKQLLLIFVLVNIAFSANAQSGKCFRYKDIIFPDIVIKKDLSYNAAAPSPDRKAYLFDLYQPLNDSVKTRPLIIWMHGGGFKYGTKESKQMKLWCKSFAQRGYVCAAINYRLSKHNPLFNFDELLKSCYYAVLDAKTAVAYFKQHAKEFNIDPDKIIIGGDSAGGMIAMQAAYSTNIDLARMAKLPGTVEGAQTKGLFKVAGVINFWGAVFNLSWLKNARVPIVSVLGDKDKVVPPTHKSAPIYGGVDIHQNADSLHIPNELKIFYGYSHELRKHFNPLFRGSKGTQMRLLDAGQFAADFFYAELFK